MLDIPSEIDGRFVHGRMNFPGNSAPKLNQHPTLPYEPFGPNYTGEAMWFLQAFYDEENDITVVVVSLNPPPEKVA